MKYRVSSNPDSFVEASGYPTLGVGVVFGYNVRLGKNVKIWNYTVIQDDCLICDNVTIGSFCDIGKNVTIGANTIIQAHVTVSNECKVGNHVFIGPNTSLLNDTYPHSNKLRPVEVCDEAIISGGVTILPDVIIGKRAFVASESVVTKDVPENVAVKTPGSPARPFMDRDDYDAKQRKYEAWTEQSPKSRSITSLWNGTIGVGNSRFGNNFASMTSEPTCILPMQQSSSPTNTSLSCCPSSFSTRMVSTYVTPRNQTPTSSSTSRMAQSEKDSYERLAPPTSAQYSLKGSFFRLMSRISSPCFRITVLLSRIARTTQPCDGCSP